LKYPATSSWWRALRHDEDNFYSWSSTAEDPDCPVNGNTCALIEAFCLDQCVGGRCLGTCELGVG